MSTNLLHLQLRPGAAADRREPLDVALLEVSRRVAAANGEQRRLYSRVQELGSGNPSLRRSHARPEPPDPHRPLTIYSIEEAAPGLSEAVAR